MKTLDDLPYSESRVVRLLARGLSNKEIAKKLKLSDKTVKNHLSHVYRKTRTKTRGQLIAKYFLIVER